MISIVISCIDSIRMMGCCLCAIGVITMAYTRSTFVIASRLVIAHVISCMHIWSSPKQTKKIIFMPQSNSKYNTNQPFLNYTNMRGIPSHVFEDTIYPVRMAISTYVLMLQILYQNFIFILQSVR